MYRFAGVEGSGRELAVGRSDRARGLRRVPLGEFELPGDAKRTIEVHRIDQDEIQRRALSTTWRHWSLLDRGLTLAAVYSREAGQLARDSMGTQTQTTIDDG